MTTVEQAMSESLRHMTVLEISAASGLDPYTVRHELQDLAEADRIDHIPARGITPGRYALKSTPAGATPDDQPAVSNNTGSDGSESLSSEAVAVATQTPEPDAGTPPSHAEGSGGDVSAIGLVQGAVSTWVAEEIDRLRAQNAEVSRLAADRLALIDTIRAQLRLAYANQMDRSASAYIVLAAKRKPLRFTKLDNAREAAKSAIRAGAQRAEVFALVSVGVARRGAEWVES